jgi:hypothetical protein
MPILLFCFLLISCQKNESLSPQENHENAPVKLKAKIIELPSPHKYQVQLSWNQPLHWLLYRENEKEGMKHLLTLTEQSRDYRDPQIISGETYTYYLAELQGDETVFKEKIIVSIPKDLYINERSDKFTMIKGPHRLFLGPKAKMITRGRFLKIDVDEIFSDNASITTFEKPALVAQQGKSGSTLVIRAKKATGVLHVIGNGEDGGRGSEGAIGMDGKKSENGNPATIRRIDITPEDLKRLRANPYNVDCTASEDTIRDVTLRTDLHHRWSCLTAPSNGANGENGGNGGKGGPGLKGGDSAKIYVEIKESAQFQIYPEQKAGLAGEGGWGGRAGKGAKGGIAGLNFTQHFCPNAQNGKDGRDGEIGMNGEKGEPGEAQPYCLKLGNITLGDCDKFVVSPEGEVW